MNPNRNVQNWHCNTCRMCNRYDSPDCQESCRMCGEYMFSEDKKNVFTNPFNPYKYQSYYYYPTNIHRPFYYYIRPQNLLNRMFYKKPVRYSNRYYI